MRLIVDGQARDFILVQEYRWAYDLPTEFGVAYFAPKEYSGLGSVDEAGHDLHAVRDVLLAAVPPTQPPEGWMAFIFTLQRLFAAQLNAINARIGLRPSEIDYAVTGLGDVLRAYLFAYGQARMRLKSPPHFDEAYQRWYEQNLDVSARQVAYQHGSDTWGIQLIASAYGRIGLVVTTPDTAHYVYDSALSCPVAGYMAGLLRDLAASIRVSIEGQEKEQVSNASSSQ